MTVTSGPQESGDSLPTAAASSMPQQREPSTGNVPRGDPGTAPGHPSPTGATRDQDREATPPPPPRSQQRRNRGPFDDVELRALYGIHATAASSELVPALGEHLKDVHPTRLFAVVPLPHAATTNVFMRQLQALVTPRSQFTDDLVDAWIWWFNTHQPDQGGIWVPHLGWAHTLIAPPTDPRPAPGTEGRERAAPSPRAETLRIPPHEGLAEWESRTVRDRGLNLTSMVERYPETARAAPLPRGRDPSTIAMIVLESGHYYQVRITAHPQESHWNLEAVDSMLPANTPLLDNPIPLTSRQFPDPLTAILFCLCRWARRRWPHTRDWTATCRFHLDGQKQLEAIPQRERTAETPTATNLCHVFAIQQIQEVAIGEQLQPAIGTETEAQAAHAALVHEILSALRSALVRRVGNPPGNLSCHEPKPEKRLQEHAGRWTRHTVLLVTAAGHRQCSDDALPRTRDASPAPATRR